MILILSLCLFVKNIYAFDSSISYALNCSISQIHIAQGLNPASMTISWVTNDNCFSHVSYGIDNKSLDHMVYGSSSSYEFYYNHKYYKSGYIHHVLLTDLKPLTLYYYQCGDLMTQSMSDILTFKTLPQTGDNTIITFGILGDIGQTIHSVSTIEHLTKEQDIDMILHAGDLSYADCEQSLWDSYGEMTEPIASYKPWMVCPGNHEIEFNGTDYTNLYTAFENRYRMPYIEPPVFGDVITKSDVNQKTGMPYCTPSVFQSEYNYGNSFYSFDSGLAHIIYLNPYTNTSPTSSQYNWLQNNLESVDRMLTPWVIVVMHCPWYSSNMNHYADSQTVLMREYMEDLFYDYKVNIVFNGHVHDYERTYPVYRNETDIHGPVYITIGNAGNLEGLDNRYYPEPKWSAFRNGTHYGYGMLTVLNNKRLLWRWYVNDGKQMVPMDKQLLCNSILGSTRCV
jgi:hypothetical protein